MRSRIPITNPNSGSARAPAPGLRRWLLSLPLATVLLWLGARSAPAAEGVWEMTVSVAQSQVLPREPVQVRVARRNTSAEAQTFRPFKPGAVLISANGAEPRRYALFETSYERVSDTEMAPISVAAGATHVETHWLLLGRESIGDEWVFLLGEPGAYTVAFPDLEDARLELTVLAAARAGEAMPAELFTGPAAAVFLGETVEATATPGTRDLERLCAEHAAGAYAPYAALALARAGRQGKAGAAVPADYYQRLDLLIDHHPEHYLREEALYLRATGLGQEGKKQDLVTCLERLVKEYPDSRFIAALEEAYWVKPGMRIQERTPAVAKSIAPAKLEFVGVAALPAGPRRILEAYWEALAAGDLEVASACLHPDFVGQDGNRAAWRSHWEWSARNSNIHSIRVEVEGAESAASYTRPHVLRDQVRTWTGSLCLVRLRTTFAFTEIRTGKEGESTAPEMTLALLEEGDAWKFVTEYTVPTPNLEAGALAMDLNRRLTLAPDQATLNQGGEGELVRDLIVAHAVGAQPGWRLASWKLISLKMDGPQQDAPVFRGEIEFVPDPEKPADRLRYAVTLSLGLEAGALRLTSIEAQPTPPAQP